MTAWLLHRLDMHKVFHNVAINALITHALPFPQDLPTIVHARKNGASCQTITQTINNPNTLLYSSCSTDSSPSRAPKRSGTAHRMRPPRVEGHVKRTP